MRFEASTTAKHRRSCQFRVTVRRKQASQRVGLQRRLIKRAVK